MVLIFYFLNATQLKLHLTDIILIALLIYSSLCLIFNHSLFNLSNEHFICCVIMIMLYFLIRLSSLALTTFFIPLLISVFYVLEIYLGITQIFSNISANKNLSLAIKGSLENSGVYSFYLIINLPIIFFIKGI